MRPRLAKFSRLTVSASLTSAAMLFIAVTVPAHGSGEGEGSPLTFDSIGSMLMDMDRDIGRERLVTLADRYSDLPRLVATAGSKSCQTQDLNNRLQEVYVGLQDRIASTDVNEGAVSPDDARLSAIKAARALHDAIASLKQQAAQEEFADNTMMIAAEAALHAAESALESAP